MTDSGAFMGWRLQYDVCVGDGSPDDGLAASPRLFVEHIQDMLNANKVRLPVHVKEVLGCQQIS